MTFDICTPCELIGKQGILVSFVYSLEKPTQIHLLLTKEKIPLLIVNTEFCANPNK